MEPRKQAIMDALSRFAHQRSGMEPGNYSDWRSYRSEQRSVTRDLHHVRELLRAVAWRDSITADNLLQCAKSAYSGRLELSLTVDPINGADYCRVNYCTGQYFPTEYRKAVCAVLASALWDWQRASMPESKGKITRRSPMGFESEHDNIEGQTPGDWLRSKFRKEFGRSLQQAYFN
jgi:hypothetical protein